MCGLLFLIILLNNVDYFVQADLQPYYARAYGENRLCSVAFHPRIPLGRYRPAFLAKEVIYGDYREAGHSHTRCRFSVATDYKVTKQGQYALIQKLSLRYDAVSKRCVDYVQFNDRQGYLSPKICGQRTTTRQTFDADGVSDIGFVAPKGVIDVTVFINRDAIERNGSKLDVAIAFTMFEQAKPTCPLEFKPCGNPNQCILGELFDDSIVNCPFARCPDEKSCRNSQAPNATDEGGAIHGGTNGQVTFGVVTALVFCAAASVTGLWFCRKHKKLCWSDENGAPASTQQTNAAYSEKTVPLTALPPPSAPPIEPGVYYQPPYNIHFQPQTFIVPPTVPKD